MTVAATTEAGARPMRAGRRPRLPAWLGTLPFFGYVGVFLLLPTGILIVDAFKNPSGSWNFGSLSTLYSPAVRDYFIGSFKLCVLSAVAGAVFGALVAYAVASGKPDGTVRRLSVAGSGVLAQFGGVTLAFAFQALIGPAGLLFHAGWYYSFPWGITLIYTYFQIPLMVIVFVPALEGLRAQWREAAVSLGASRWQYFREVVVPLLTPAFLGSALLLFANAFAAYATAAALVSQGSPIVPLLIRSALTSEVVLGQSGFAYALALEMIVVVAAVMAAYNVLVRRTARWLR